MLASDFLQGCGVSSLYFFIKSLLLNLYYVLLTSQFGTATLLVLYGVGRKKLGHPRGKSAPHMHG